MGFTPAALPAQGMGVGVNLDWRTEPYAAYQVVVRRSDTDRRCSYALHSADKERVQLSKLVEIPERL